MAMIVILQVPQNDPEGEMLAGRDSKPSSEEYEPSLRSVHRCGFQVPPFIGQ